MFNVFQAAQTQPTTPAITPDGTSVITGIPLAPTSSGQFAANWNVTSLASFPGGPFTNSRRAGNHSFGATGATSEPDVRSDGVLASEVTGGLLVSFSNGLSTFSDVGSHPTLSDPTNNVVVFQLTNPATVNGEPQYTDLAFKPITGFGTTPATFLPPIISGSGTDELQPDFTPDGRYLGFIRNEHHTDHHDPLFVFDTQTQTMLNSSGIDLGYFSFSCEKAAGPFEQFGGVSLRETFTLPLDEDADRLFGRLVPTVPFGQFSRGHHHVRWNLDVAGRRLRPGTYQVTPRLLTRGGIVHELGKPHMIRIR